MSERAARLEGKATSEQRGAPAPKEEGGLLRVILDNTRAHLAYLDRHFNLVRVNAAYAHGCGCTPEELIGRNQFELFPDPANQALYEQVRDSGQAVDFRARPLDFPRHPEWGTTYWDGTLTPVKDEAGVVQGLVLSFLDVTERERVKREREAHMASLDTLLQISQQVLAEKTLEGLLQRVVNAARELTGAALGEVRYGEKSARLAVFSRAGSPWAGQGMELDLDPTFLERVARDGAVRVPGEPSPSDAEPMRRLLGVRLVGRDGRPSGIIAIADKEQGNFTVDDEVMMVQLAALASLGLQHFEARLEVERQVDQLDAIFSSITDVVIVYDANGRAVKANPASVEAYGLDPVDVDRGRLAQRMPVRHADGRPVTNEELPASRALRGERVIGERFFFNDVRGREVVILASAAPVYVQGRLAGAVVVWHDVTERERLLAALADERARLEAVIENGPEGVVVVNETGRVVLANPAARQLYRRPGDGDIPERSEEMALCHPDGTPYDPNDLPLTRSALYGESYRKVEMTLLNSDGWRRDMLLSSAPIHDGQGRRSGAVGMFQDISEIKEMELALRQNAERMNELNEQVQRHASELEQRVAERTAEVQVSEARSRAILEHAAIGIVIVDLEGKYVESNPAFQEMVGYSNEELQGRTLAQLVHLEDAATDAGLFRELVAGKRDLYHLEMRYVRKDGTLRWSNRIFSLVRDVAGEPQYVIGLTEDTTEQRQVQAALIQAEKMSVVGKLAGSLAHEINNPLQSVTGCLGLAAEALEAGEDISRYLQVAQEEVRRAARTVAQMRDLNRRPRPEERKLISVNDLLEQVLALSKKKCQENKILVEWDRTAEVPLLPLVPDLVQQVFFNLTVNAIEAMPEGGHLRLKTELSFVPEASRGRQDKGAATGRVIDGVRVTIADTGAGIPAHILPHIFDPFYTTRPEGLGIGLYSSRNTIEEHGGRIEVESRLGQGTTFTVWLPA